MIAFPPLHWATSPTRTLLVDFRWSRDNCLIGALNKMFYGSLKLTFKSLYESTIRDGVTSIPFGLPLHIGRLSTGFYSGTVALFVGTSCVN